MSGPAADLFSMHICRVDFCHAVYSNPFPLFDSEWMVSGLKLNERAYAVVAQMDVRFEVLGVRLDFEVSRQPAEVRPVFRPILAIQQPNKLLEIARAK
jgi:hypothetical protein